MERRKSRRVKVGNIYIGGSERITVQSMLNRPATDIEGSVKQAVELEKAGCEIIRAAVPDMAAVKLIEKLKENVSVPVVADIHFDYRLALASLEAGVDKIRINPGNIGSMDKVYAVAHACAEKSVPIRIGVNSGSVEKELLAKYGFDLDIRYTELNAERIAAVHAVGAKVNCWTCNDKDRGEELCKWGVDFITSNILE